MADGHKLDLPPQSGGMAHPAGLTLKHWFSGTSAAPLASGVETSS
jgi:hypothetical protein